MIQADLQGKTGVAEDVLTSCCLGLLRLLPDEYLIEALSLARRQDGRPIALAEARSVRELEFWPWLHNGGEADAIATIVSDAWLRPKKIVIEVKHGAPKSSRDQDQLAKYFNAAAKEFPHHDVLLIYLTHHRSIPVEDLNESLLQIDGDASLCWLSWYDIAKWASFKLLQRALSTSEYRVLSALKDYLGTKGYRRFARWEPVPDEAWIMRPYTRRYIAGILTAPEPGPWLVYSRGYWERAGEVICPIYQPRGARL